MYVDYGTKCITDDSMIPNVDNTFCCFFLIEEYRSSGSQTRQHSLRSTNPEGLFDKFFHFDVYFGFPLLSYINMSLCLNNCYIFLINIIFL